MEAERAGDIRVPLISFIFCLCLIAGGVFLALYVFAHDLSQPWYPVAAFTLIGLPWIFWFLAYTYTFTKRCFAPSGDTAGCNADGRQISRRQTTRSVSIAAAAAEGKDDGGNQDRHSSGTSTPSVASSKESEMPLAYSV